MKKSEIYYSVAGYLDEASSYIDDAERMLKDLKVFYEENIGENHPKRLGNYLEDIIQAGMDLIRIRDEVDGMCSDYLEEAETEEEKENE